MTKKQTKRKVKWYNIAAPIITPAVALAIALPLTLIKHGEVAAVHTLTFEDGYDDKSPVITTEKVNNGEKAQMPLPEHHAGAGFIGWKTVKGDDTAPYFDFMNTPVTSDMKFYGYWKRSVDTNAFKAKYTQEGYGPYLQCDVDYCEQNNIVDLVAPEELDGKPIKGVYEMAFSGNSSHFERTIRSLSIPDSIEVFDAYAFCGCEGLRILNMPENLKTIKSNAFFMCVKLADFKFHEGLEIIEDEAFSGSEGEAGSEFSYIKTLTLPSTLKYIGKNAFRLNSLQKLDMSKCTNLTLSSYAFNFAINLIEVVLPPNLQNIPEQCFGYCTRLRYVSIPKTVKYIDQYAFTNCYRIRVATIEDESELLSIGYNAFNNCFSLEKINFPRNLKYLDEDAFCNCNNISSVSFEKIREWQYTTGYAEEMKTVKWTPSETDTSYNAKQILKWLRDETSSALSVQVISDASKIHYLSDDESKCVIIGVDDDFSVGKITIPATVTDSTNGKTYDVVGIGHSAFTGQTDITEVEFATGSKLEYILDSAFYCCVKLNKINLEACTKLTYIGNDAFHLAFTNGNSLDIDMSGLPIEYIGDYAFGSIDEETTENGVLNSVKLPTTLTYLGNGAFHNQKNITALDFTGCTKLEKIGNYKDNELLCDSLINSTQTTTTFEIDLSHTKLTYLPRGVFQKNTNLEKVTLPSTITEIYEYAFEGCSNLGEINIPQNCYYIRYNAFDGCGGTNDFKAKFVDTTTKWNLYKSSTHNTFTPSGTYAANGVALRDTYKDYTWYKQLN